MSKSLSLEKSSKQKSISKDKAISHDARMARWLSNITPSREQDLCFVNLELNTLEYYKGNMANIVKKHWFNLVIQKRQNRFHV